jgi:hypothetical protein
MIVWGRVFPERINIGDLPSIWVATSLRLGAEWINRGKGESPLAQVFSFSASWPL